MLLFPVKVQIFFQRQFGGIINQKKIKMRKINFIAIIFAAILFFPSCENDLDGNESIVPASEGGLLTISNAPISYVVGNEATYTITGSVLQGGIKATKIEVYKSFTSTAGSEGDVVSNEVLFTTLEPTQEEGQTISFSYSFDYADLISGLTVGGASLPASDSELTIGDNWNFRYEVTTTAGDVVQGAVKSKVSVATRFAGSYRTLDAVYYRIGVVTYTTANWPAETVIESVDATTYRVVEYFGAEPFSGNEWYFQIDENDVITYPEKTPSGDDQLGNDLPFITCDRNPNDMTNVPCGAGESNYVERDDENGADKLYMSFGYYNAGDSGSREFYHVLEKIVD